LLNRIVGHSERFLPDSRIEQLGDFASTALWVNWADLYPSAASANTNDTRPAERLHVKLEEINRRRRNGHDGSVIDRAKPAAFNL